VQPRLVQWNAVSEVRPGLAGQRGRFGGYLPAEFVEGCGKERCGVAHADFQYPAGPDHSNDGDQ
jgi:hypothetical protein